MNYLYYNLIILIVISLFFYFINKYFTKIEYFNNLFYNLENNLVNDNLNKEINKYENKMCNHSDELSGERIIWMYWETLPGKTKPGYIDLCIDSVKFNCGKCFNIIVLDNITIYDYLPEIKNIDFSNLNLPQKVDYYRYALLEKYGGVWLDADILVIKCICPFYEKLSNSDYVGFGCGHDLEVCRKNPYGYSRPLNWFMISKKNTPFIKCVKNKAYNKIIKANKNNQKLPYHSIGKVILQQCYEELNSENNWNYAHIPSKCQEFDNEGNKLNNIMIDFNWKDCEKERIFFPLYNTAPGYPDWFKNLSVEELKTKESYLKPLIIQAFTEKSY
jgi:mannosyltransferase OCH1-like enzyme